MIIQESNLYQKEENISIIRISGNDATAFLQGQFSNDVSELTNIKYQISTYCTNQGKVIAIFRIFKLKKEFFLMVNKDVVNKVLERLSMYKLASDVIISQSEDMNIYSTLDKKSNDQEDPISKYELSEKDNILILSNHHINIISNLFITKMTEEDFIDYKGQYSKVDFSILHLVDMLKGIHHVNEYSCEKFIPQNLNMSADMGINFKKGCYIGQEIIARTHYLGKVKKNIAIIKSDIVFKKSEKINNTNGEIVGEIIDEVFYTSKNIRLYMIMIREINKSDKIFVNDNLVELLN